MNNGKEPIPKSWRKIGRHSSQGYCLTDMVGLTRVQKVAADVIKCVGIFVRVPEMLYRLDMQFRTAFFSGKFGELDMVTAAEIYVDYLERHATWQLSEEANNETFRRHTKEVLTDLDPKKFFVHCFHYGWPVPKSFAQARCIMHQLRLEQSWLSEDEKRKSREWLQPGGAVEI